jgi:predicted DNA-binding transcriptional regulator AlpA
MAKIAGREIALEPSSVLGGSTPRRCPDISKLAGLGYSVSLQRDSKQQERFMSDELLDMYEACRVIGGSRPINPATLWRGVKAGRYAKPIKVGPQAVRWRRSELMANIQRMIDERDSAALPQYKERNIQCPKTTKPVEPARLREGRLILIKSRRASGYDMDDGYCLHDGYAPVYGDNFNLSAADVVECCKEYAERDDTAAAGAGAE